MARTIDGALKHGVANLFAGCSPLRSPTG